MSEPQRTSKTWTQQTGCTPKIEANKHRCYPGALRLNPTRHLSSYDKGNTARKELAHLNKGAHGQRQVQHTAKPTPIATRCIICDTCSTLHKPRHRTDHDHILKRRGGHAHRLAARDAGPEPQRALCGIGRPLANRVRGRKRRAAQHEHRQGHLAPERPWGE